MKDLLNNGFQIVSEREMLMVEGGGGASDMVIDGDNPGAQRPTPPPHPSNGGGCGDVNWLVMR